MSQVDKEFDPTREGGNFDPVMTEADDHNLKITGEIPHGLRGTLFRNGPNPQFVDPQLASHWFSGDGMLHAFRLGGGKASYQNRWIRTPKWQAENDAGRPLFGAFGRRLTNLPAVDSGTANTHVIQHAGRLLALEEAHLPIEIEPADLRTKGYYDFEGSLAGPFTAHPKIDPITGELLFFGYSVDGKLSPRMRLGIADNKGVITATKSFEAPYSSMVHDFIVTSNFILVPILPVTGSAERRGAGKPPFMWEPNKGAYIGLLRRGALDSDIRWFRGEQCYIFHVMNAWEEAGKVHAHVMQYKDPVLFPRVDDTPADPEATRARLCKWTFDLESDSDQFSQCYLDDLFGEFPRLDERRAGLPYRFGWYACKHPSSIDSRGYFDAIAQFDFETGNRILHQVPKGDGVSEPIFVPRQPDAREGDGWLLVVVWRSAENRSDLIILDASDIRRPPVGIVHLPRRVPFGFHGNWVDSPH
jgi:carotenoid cleavage dioxygenase